MKKRLLALLLVVSTLMSLCTGFASAALSEEEALGAVDIYSGGTELSYLAINGRVRTQIYTYYNYVSSDGTAKEIPAYCVNPDIAGVPQTVAPGQSIEYLADSKTTDPKVLGIVANGYPTRGLGELKLENKYHAYYATKMALWCYILPNWDINNLKVNPNLSGVELERAQKILAAAKDIYVRGTAWNEILSPEVTCTPDRAEAYPVTVDGRQYKQQVFTFGSKTWVCDYTVDVAFTTPGSVPAGTRIVDANNKDITAITTCDTGGGYAGQFKVLYPAERVEGQSGSVQLSFHANVYKYGVYYAVCAEKDKYGELQNYMVDTDPTTEMRLSAYSNFADGSIVEPPDTGLKITKLETGSELPLSGALFEVVDPDGATVGTFSTNGSGEILLPLTLCGNYTVLEKAAPAHHLLGDATAQNVNVEYGKVANVTFYNAPYGTLRIEKYSNTGAALPGAVITVQHIASGKTYTATTNFSGCAIFTQLQPGAYRVQETTAPVGWKLDSTVHIAAVVTGETTTIPIINEELPGLRIIKYDRKNMVAMPSVTFEVFRDAVSLGKFRTDEFGEILLTNVTPGTYRAAEVDTGSDGHILDTTPQEVELKAGDGIKELLFFNDVKPGLRLVKVDSTDPSKVIPNAVFEIKSVAGDYGPQEFTTDEHGEIDLSKLPAGAYVVTEKSCPGYVIDQAQRIIQLDPNEDAHFVFTNSIRPSLQLIKTSADGSRLAGVTFRIARIADGSRYLDRTTNAQGEILISDLEPGVYLVKESATKPDHILDTKEYHVELFAGRTSTIVLQNDKRPNLVVYKYDADTGAPVPGTVFQVKAADGHSVDEIKTGADGSATLKNLLPSVYEISEKSVPSPYLLDAPSQLVTLYPNRDHTVYFENHKKPTLTIIKEDSVTHGRIANVKFQVWWASNKTDTGELRDLGTHFTDENGEITLSGIEDGWLKITELEPAPGYAIKDPATQECYIKGGESKTVTFQNTPLSALVVWKYDSVTGEAVKNAVFQVKYLSGTSGTGGTVIGTYKTSANGAFTVTGLAAGTYVVEELASDSGHVIDTAPQTAYISGVEQEVVQLYFGNSPKGGLLIKKIDSVTHKPLSDVEFMVTTSDGTVVGSANGKYVTDSAGSILIENIAPGTTLVVKETRAKDGYLLDDVPQTAKIKAGETVPLEFRNQPTSALLIVKKDAVTGEPLSGVEFLVTDSEGGVIGSANGKFVTDAAGTIRISGLTPGMTVIAKETRAKDGYLLDDSPQTSKIKANETVTLEFRNQPTSALLIVKKDAVTGESLSGVEFLVTDSEGGVIGSANGKFVTDAAGTIRVSGLTPGMTVIAKETRAKDGYLMDDTPQTAKIKTNETVTLEFRNQPKGNLIVLKKDSVTGAALQGVSFKITYADGSFLPVEGGKLSSNGLYTTDQNGKITLSGVTGTLVVTETQTIPGYTIDEATRTQTVVVNPGDTQTLTFTNTPTTTLIIQKYIEGSKNSPISGVEFLVTDSFGAVVGPNNGKYTTDANGRIAIPGLTPGSTVTAKETKTAEGFVLDGSPQSIQIKAGEVQTLTFWNKRAGGLELIKVNETDKTQRIPNVTFEIRKIDGALVDTVTTGKNGRVYVPLDAGDYYAVETEAAEGFKLDDTPQYFTIKDNEATTLTVTNKEFSGILIHKIDSVTRKGIYGVTFLLYDGKMNPVEQFTTDQRGYAYIDTLELSGKVYLRELDNDGYIPDEQLKTVYVRPGETTEITWENTAITGQIQIVKKSADYNPVTGLPAGTLLEGAVFEITDKAGNLVDTIRSDSRGLAVSRQLPLSRYTIREVKAPDHYGVSETELTAYLEHEGQILRFEVTNKSMTTGVSITKTGPKEITAGQPVRYVFSGIANTSNVRLDNFYWRDTIPAEVRLDTVITGTYNFPGTYKITYRMNGGEPQTLADNLSTSKNYTLAASATALGLASNQRVTEVMFVFGQAPAGFAQVEKPYLYCTALSSLNVTSFVNVADAGGSANGKWVQAVSRWVTTVYGMPTPLPRTGY